jgi:hypothetical protein
MREPASRSDAIRETIGIVGLLAALLFGGMAIGLGIALAFGGGSVGAIVVGFLALPLAFGLAMTAWRSILAAWLMGGLARSIIRSRGSEERFRADVTRSMAAARASGVLPGTWVFVPVTAAVGVAAGLAMAIAAEGDRLAAGGLILAASIAYGVGLRRLARRGLLPIPED